MESGVFSLISRDRLEDVLGNLQAFTGLAIQLIDSGGGVLLSFGQAPDCCATLEREVFRRGECAQLHMKAGQRARALGETYVFSCPANLNHIAFPLLHQGELLGSVIIGPFLMDAPDSTLVSDLAERRHVGPTLALELYDELGGLEVLPPARVNQLMKLTDHLLSPPDARGAGAAAGGPAEDVPAGPDQRDHPDLQGGEAGPVRGLLL